MYNVHLCLIVTQYFYDHNFLSNTQIIMSYNYADWITILL